ncbi:flagellar protein FlgN [Nitrospira sp. M1]
MSSASLWEKLRHLFHDEYLAYEHLTELLHEEWTVLRQLDYLQLLDVTRRKEVVMIRIRSIEEERVACVKTLQQSTPQEEPLAWVAQSTVPEAAPAKRALTQLVSIGQQVQALSNQNSGLINRGLQVVREAMSLVHEGVGVKPLYGESGCLTFAAASTSLNVEG